MSYIRNLGDEKKKNTRGNDVSGKSLQIFFSRSNYPSEPQAFLMSNLNLMKDEK